MKHRRGRPQMERAKLDFSSIMTNAFFHSYLSLVSDLFFQAIKDK